MSRPILILVYFLYGLSFFSMGQIVALEGGRGSDERLRHALRPLAVFGLIHGLHEWMELFILLGDLPYFKEAVLVWQGISLAFLAFSFLSLAAFGASLLSPSERIRRLSLLLPLVQGAIWGFGLLVMRGRFLPETELWNVADVWTRYVLGIPAALVACAGLIAQQRAFRMAGMVQFGRDTLWAAIAFAWYGLIGQAFAKPSPIFPSYLFNEASFLATFGFPVQILRAIAGGAASAFVVRFLRAFEVETQRKLDELQELRLRSAEDRVERRAAMLRRIVAAQEAERQRVARELHDETGQALTAIGLGLRGIAGTVRANPENAAEGLGRLEELVSHSLDELRRLIADLRPSHIDDLGLPAALRWYAKEVYTRTGLHVSVSIAGEQTEVQAPVNIALFRITQEALTNAIKHADASRVQLHLDFEPERVSLVVEDNGRGFAPGEAEKSDRASWGLMGMRERAVLLGGEMDLDSSPGHGTRIQVCIPTPTQEKVVDEDTIAVGG